VMVTSNPFDKAKLLQKVAQRIETQCSCLTFRGEPDREIWPLPSFEQCSVGGRFSPTRPPNGSSARYLTGTRS
jgi:hypothetical protein